MYSGTASVTCEITSGGVAIAATIKIASTTNFRDLFKAAIETNPVLFKKKMAVGV
jgi:hypothetical protein